MFFGKTVPVMTALLLSMLGMTLSAADAADGGTFKIRGGNFANWWIAGDTVTFKPTGKLPGGITKITGTVFDSTGKKVGEQSVAPAAFAADGWQWKPARPGFYEVKFVLGNAAGTLTPAQEAIDCKIYEWIKGKPHLRLQQDFIRQCHNFAVLPCATRPPAEIPPQLVVSLGPAHEKKQFRIDWSDANIRLAALIGFHSVRIHTISWSMIEGKQGQYDWSILDHFIAEAKKNGFQHFIGNPFGTPKWASTHPEKINLNICVWEYTAYAPAKMSYWSDFLKVLVKRYPFIKTWELWNEPHLPGQSCFWSDSPENFVELLKTGYQAVKEVQPDATIWIGGMGMRYLPFYETIMKLGAGKYFDVLALHGSWVSPTPFQRIGQEAGAKPKPWVSSEWHSMLASAGEAVTPSEETLARNMLVDFMNHIRQGAEIVTFFTTTNVPHGREQEMMDFFRKNKQFFQTFGLFRATPYIEPRLLAVVWRNFSDCFAGKITYDDGYYFDGGKQRAALMKSDRGPVLFIWSNTDQPVKLCAELVAAAGAGATLSDWEGRPVAADGLILRPDVVYFLKNPAAATVAGWTGRGQILKQRQKEPELDRSTNGCYRPGRIFDAAMNIADGAKLTWQPLKKYVPAVPGKPAEGFAVRFAAAVDGNGFDLLAEVADRTHAQPHADGNIWAGDSIQFAIDTVGKGLPEDRLEISAALTPRGPLLWKEAMPSLGGDLPGRITFAGRPLRYGKIVIDKTAEGLRYKIRIDRDDLYPFTYLQGSPVRFSLLVNNDDGAGRAGYLEWASGIGNTKDPAQYGTLTVDIGRQTLFDQAALRHKWGAATLEPRPDGTVKVRSTGGTAKNAAALATGEVKAIPGARYRISFQARGDVTFYGMCNVITGKRGERQDFLSRQQLNADWKPYQAMFTVPPGAAKFNVSLFCWQQDGWFEVKDFKMATE